MGLIFTIKRLFLNKDISPMKKTIFIVCLFFTTLQLSAQVIKCSEICILNISFDSVSKLLDVNIYNGPNGNQINYPVVIVMNANGDTVANKTNQFYYFCHLVNDTMVHSLPTTLTSLPAGFTGTITIMDYPTSTKCTFNYPMTCTVGIEEYAQTNFKLYPNPTTDFFSIDFTGNTEFEKTITIHDVSGKAMQTIKTNQLLINVSTKQFARGIYFITISDEKNSITRKLIVN